MVSKKFPLHSSLKLLKQVADVGRWRCPTFSHLFWFYNRPIWQYF